MEVVKRDNKAFWQQEWEDGKVNHLKSLVSKNLLRRKRRRRDGLGTDKENPSPGEEDLDRKAGERISKVFWRAGVREERRTKAERQRESQQNEKESIHQAILLRSSFASCPDG